MAGGMEKDELVGRPCESTMPGAGKLEVNGEGLKLTPYQSAAVILWSPSSNRHGVKLMHDDLCAIFC